MKKKYKEKLARKGHEFKCIAKHVIECLNKGREGGTVKTWAKTCSKCTSELNETLRKREECQQVKAKVRGLNKQGEKTKWMRGRKKQ